MDDRPRRRRPLRRLVVALVVLVAIVHVGGGWYFADLLQERGLDGASRRASTDFTPDTEILATSSDPVTPGGTVTLEVDETPGGLLTDGIWGLRWDDGYGQVAGILENGGDSVTRAFQVVEGDPPDVGDPAQLDMRAYPAPAPGDADVVIRGPLGDYPAWFAPGAADTWAIIVHGNSMMRTDGIRLGPILAVRAYPTLWVTYRNDVGAPEDPSGLLRYGLTEWEDLEAAVRYALDEGAADVVLVGYSMGGGVIMSFLQRSALADAVRGIVLDAPMLDFSATVDDNASRQTLPVVGLPLPPTITWTAKWIADRRYDIRWAELDYLAEAETYEGIPFLVFHGTEDLTVPIATSREFARLLPDDVTLLECPQADHIECWNVDGERYARELLGFLAKVGA